MDCFMIMLSNYIRINIACKELYLNKIVKSTVLLFLEYTNVITAGFYFVENLLFYLFNVFLSEYKKSINAIGMLFVNVALTE
jgi:hypothetical protein